jgi:hypothetical protein
MVIDDESLDEWRNAIGSRARRGIAENQAQLERLHLDEPPTLPQVMEAMWLQRSVALLHLYDGRLEEAKRWLNRALELSSTPGVPADIRANLRASLGIAALRRGEVENCIACVGPSSCIFPIAPEAVHQNQNGSREAVGHFTALLDEDPGDVRIRWLLNLAYMTLGEYPEKVPARYLVPIDGFRSEAKVGRFTNVASHAGLNARGPGQAGGSIFDDFNGDGLPDVFVSSFDAQDGASLFLNRGDGTFADHSDQAGLKEQIYALNVARADYDNDGDLDLVLLRGGWESPVRMSLLRNDGQGKFEDVTLGAGLGLPIASEVAAWGDYDNDGWLDLFVGGEYLPCAEVHPPPVPDPRNRCRLYHNNGDGTFTDVAPAAGVTNEQCTKGVAWGDYDEDGDLDLFVSNMGGPARLYRNEGDGTFRDVAGSSGITESRAGFTCLFWDYDNDGHLDLYVSEYKASMSEVVAGLLGLPVNADLHPRLYRNNGDGAFTDEAVDAGLGRPLPAMSANCGDVDNDGFLDLDLGIGWMSFSGLAPDRLFHNEAGRRFADATESAGTGHLQKGHGISFADYDDDGDLDIFVVLGGGYPGDKGYTALFQNPGNARHWLKVKLIGNRTNRAAIGAKLQVDLEAEDGTTRSIHRTIGNNGSFGGNSLVELVGLGDSAAIEQLTVTWPTSHTTQTFRDLPADRSIEITEGKDQPRLLDRPIRSP